MTKKKQIMLFIICLELLFIGAVVLHGDKRERIHFTFDRKALQNQAGESLSEQDMEQTVQSPLLTLPKGCYEIKIDYYAQNAENKLLFFKDHIDYSEYDPVLNDFVYLPSACDGETDQTFQTHVNLNNGTDCFRIRIQYAGKGTLRVNSVSILTDESYPYMANQIFRCLLTFLILDLAGLLFLYRDSVVIRKRFSDKSCLTIVFGIVFITVFASYPLFTDFLVDAHDLDFHLGRIENIKDGLLSGAFPVRIGPSWLKGYGYAASVFYSDLFLYFPGVLRLVGISLQNAYKSYVVMVNLATALIAYFCFWRLTGYKKLGLILSGIYSLAIYRLMLIYVRGAVGEFSAMTFLPLTAYGIIRIFWKDSQWKEYRKSILLLTAGLSGIIHTHVLTCEMVAVFILIFCFLFIKKIFHKRRFLALAGTAALTILVNAWFLFPFFYYMAKESFIVESKAFTGIQSQGMFWTQLFTWNFRGHGQSVDALYGMRGEISLGIGWTFLIAVMAAVFLFVRREWENTKWKKVGALSLILAFISIWMCTVSFPYDIIRNLFSPLGRILAQVQFPWRYLGISTLLLTFLCMAVLAQLKQKSEEQTVMLAGLMLLLCLIQGGTMMDDTFQGSDAVIYRRYGISDVSQYVSGGEYLPTGADVSNLTDELTVSEDVYAVIEKRRFNHFKVNCKVDGREGYFELPLIYYTGYCARDEITGERFAVEPGKGMRIRICVPQGYQGNILVSFKEPVSWRLAEMVSVIAAVTILAGWLAERKKQRYIAAGDKLENSMVGKRTRMD